MTENACEYCGGPIPLERPCCPHCGRFYDYPNLKQAKHSAKGLDHRYRAALETAVAQGTLAAVESFEAAARCSKAVIARPLREALRLASSDRELVSTYYRLLEAEACLPFNDKWDVLRGQADEVLFRGYRENIRFAALALDGIGISAFGECSLTLKEEAIAHRATVFEDNSAALFERSLLKEETSHRATWEERSKLCVAKHAGEIETSTPPCEYTRLLLRQGSATQEPRFIEVHIWGSMSIRSVERIILTSPPHEDIEQVFAMELEDLCANFGIALEIYK